MTRDIDWTLCIICQRETNEELRCPFRDHLEVYSAFVKNVREYRRIESLPAQIHLPEEGSALPENQAKWHKQCHQKFNNTTLEGAKLKRQREENLVAESGPLSKRR